MKLGMQCRAYINTGSTYSSPTWAPMNNIKDVTSNLDKGKWDASVRGSGGFKYNVGTLKEWSFDIPLIYDSADTAIFPKLLASYLTGTTVDIVLLDGDVTVTGSQGPRIVGEVMKMSRDEKLEEGVVYNFSIEPTFGPNPPVWFVTPGP